MLFSHSWGGRDDYRNWWRRIFRWFFLILVANVPRVIAEPLDKYCLSPVERKPETRLTLSPNKPARVTIPTRGQSLEVVVSGVDTLLLKRSGATTPLVSVTAPQYDYGQIEALVSTQDGWLWIDGGQIDYHWSSRYILGTIIPYHLRDHCWRVWNSTPIQRLSRLSFFNLAFQEPNSV